MRSKLVLAICALVHALGVPAVGTAGEAARPPSTIHFAPLERLRGHPAMAPKVQLAGPWRKVSHLLRESVVTLAVDGVTETAARVDVLRGKGLQARNDDRVRVAAHVSSLTGAQAAIVKGAAGRLGLRRGPNGVRVIVANLHSNIVIVAR